MYKNYAYLNADRLARFGGYRGYADSAGAFSLRVHGSSTDSNWTIGSRLIMFGD